MESLAVTLPWRLVLYTLAGLAGGVANGVAGGGTFITFPTMLALGVPALQANVSSTVGVLPSYFGGIQSFRREVHTHRRLLLTLAPLCAVGAAVGCALLLVAPATVFRRVIPWLIGGATLLFALAPSLPRLTRRPDARVHPVWLAVGVFAVAVYNGYFGAGTGILLLALLSLTWPSHHHDAHAMRSALSTMMALVAATIFVVRGHLAVAAVFGLLVGTYLGGWVGAFAVRRLSARVVRLVVISIGLVTTVRLW